MLVGEVRHLVVLKGGMTKKKFDAAMAHLAGIPGMEERVLLGTGCVVGEGFDDAIAIRLLMCIM
jgi:hypothetical protein